MPDFICADKFLLHLISCLIAIKLLELISGLNLISMTLNQRYTFISNGFIRVSPYSINIRMWQVSKRFIILFCLNKHIKWKFKKHFYFKFAGISSVIWFHKTKRKKNRTKMVNSACKMLHVLIHPHCLNYVTWIALNKYIYKKRKCLLRNLISWPIFFSLG